MRALRRFRDLSIRAKLVRVGVVTSLVAVVCSGGAFLVFDRLTFRRGILHDLEVEAEIISANSASALLFQNRDAASRTLSALQAERHVVAGAIYNVDGRPFAAWSRAGGSFAVPGVAEEPGSRFEDGAVIVFRPVMFEGARLGTVFIRSDLSELGERQRRVLLIALIVALTACGVTLALSQRLQRTITEPLQRLVDTARAVSLRQDYSQRVRPAGGYEMGLLIRTFNEMLGTLQHRERDLAEAREGLERRVAERTRELARSQFLLAEAQRLTHMGSFEWDPAADLLLWSEEMYRIFGREPGFRPDYDSFMDAVHPEDRPRVEARVQQAVLRDEAFDIEYRIVRPDGQVRTIYAYAVLLVDETGRPLRMVGTAQDITERKAAEEERTQLVREQGARAEAEAARRRSAFLAEAGASFAQTLDDKGTLMTLGRCAVPELGDWSLVLLEADGGGFELVAAQHADAARLPALQRLAEQLLSYGRDGLEDVRRGGRLRLLATPADWPSLGEDGEVLRAQVGVASALLVPLQARSRAFGLLAVGSAGRPLRAEDLDLAQAFAQRGALHADNARLLREAQEANTLKDEFLATLSHELRTPLNAIVGWTKLLQSGELDEANRVKAIDTIDRNARAQTQLIEDILDVSRIVAGKLHLKVQPTDMVTVVEAALDSVRHAAEAKGIRLQADLRSVGPLYADPDRLQQVVWNLLSNAIKFTPREGGVAVRLQEVEGHALVEVQDDGAGIEPEFLPHVFERFRQADSSSTRPHSGLGLGLAIVRHLVELHGGTVSVASEGKGCGATFSVRVPLPLERPYPPGRAWAHRRAAVTDDEKAPARLQGLEVMVVEDEKDARDLIRTVLEQQGARVTAVSSAGEAMRLFRRRPPDVLLSDVEMPDVNGYDLMRQVRELPPQHGGGVPSAALTAYARPQDREAALAAGFQVHLAKPVAPEQLAATVAALAGRHSG
jgi:PAS domain S-box-containing protein